MSATDKIAIYAKDLKYEDLPREAVESVKIHVLDTIGAILAGSVAEGSKSLAGLVREWGGRKEGTVFVFGDKVPISHAAWVNSVMSRGYDYETILSGGATHVSASIIPAAFAFAEYCKSYRGKTINGRDLITAIAMGTDLNWRFRVAGRESTVMSGGWLAETFAPPAIAALGGNMFGFDRDKILNAMAIGYNQCCGTYGATVGENGGMMAQLSQGLGAKTGVLSVMLADRGFTAFQDVIDGRWGLYTMYGNGEYDADVLVGELGKRFDSLTPGIKRYPGCGATQPVVYGTLELIRENNISPEEVAGVSITVGEASYRLCGENKFAPLNSADALWNYRYSAAVALAKGKVFVDDFTEEAIKDQKVLDLIGKIDVDSDKTLRHGIRVAINTKDGKSCQKSVDEMEPLSEDWIINKFKGCNRFSVKPMPEKDVETFIQAVTQLEEVKDISEIINLLS